MNKGDNILVDKILHGFLEGFEWMDFLQMADSSRLQGHQLNLGKGRSRLDLRKLTLSQKMESVNMLNDLPADVTDSSVNAFKNKLEAYLKNLP